MSPHYVAFLIVFAILASISVSSPSPVSATLSTFVTEDHVNYQSRRSLSAVGEESEEKFPQIPSSIVERVKGYLQPISESTINRWLNNKKSIDKVFVRLHLDTAGHKLFEHPQFITWTEYVNALNTKTRESSTPVISKLTRYYGDRDLTKMIEIAKKNPATKSIANDLQTQQFKFWSNSFDGGPDGAFRALYLSFARDKLLENPLFFTWLNYVKFFNENTNKQQTFFKTLGQYYDDDAITMMIETAKMTPSTVDFGRKLRFEQVERWMT